MSLSKAPLQALFGHPIETAESQLVLHYNLIHCRLMVLSAIERGSLTSGASKSTEENDESMCYAGRAAAAPCR